MVVEDGGGKVVEEEVSQLPRCVDFVIVAGRARGLGVVSLEEICPRGDPQLPWILRAPSAGVLDSVSSETVAASRIQNSCLDCENIN